MCFDECVAYPVEHYAARQAMERTVAWARRCKAAHAARKQVLFGIVQGSVFHDLRAECAERLVEMDFPGYAVGGLSVGEGQDLMNEVLDVTVPHLPADRPRYLMGVGTPEDILEAVERGIDMFDCVTPTRNARGACAFTPRGKVRLRNRQYRLADDPIDEACDCYTCRNFTRGYLRHLFIAKEALAGILTSIHNIRFYQRLMEGIRDALENGEFRGFKSRFLRDYTSEGLE